MENIDIQYVDAARVMAVIEDPGVPDNAGLYFCALQEDQWVAVDNANGHAWTEEFTNQVMALKYLYLRRQYVQHSNRGRGPDYVGD